MIVDGLIALLGGESTVTDLVAATHIWSQVADQSVGDDPHILIHRLGENHNLTLTDTGGLIFADVDVDCKARTPGKAAEVAHAVREFLKDYEGAAGDVTVKAVLLNDESDDFESPESGRGVGRYVTSLNFEVQYSP